MLAQDHEAGVTVIVCCHNSAARLPRTLAHLAAQQVPEGIGFETVVVDNASTDDTAEVARRLWPGDARFPLRVVHEPTPGLSHARRRGFAEARHAFVSFVDDDNWVCPQWVHVVHEVLSQNPTVAACGGPSEGVFEFPPPDWFRLYQGNFGVGPQHEETGDVTNRTNVLWGAGLSVRKSAWEELCEDGFYFSLSGRSGAGLTGGEDCELCYALLLRGWRLWYDSRLRLQHYMPKERLTWSYLRRLLRGLGWSGPWIDPYKEAAGHQPRQHWTWAALKLAFLLARNPLRLLRCSLRPAEGQPAVVAHELLVGRLSALVRHAGAIEKVRQRLQQSPRTSRLLHPPMTFR